VSGEDGAKHVVPAAQTAWAVVAAGTALLILLAGWVVNGEFFGAFIDSRNRYSLARLQLAAWTAVVLSAWLAIVFVRVGTNIGVGEALEVNIPGPVVAALGLSVGSFALSAGIKDAKRRQTVTATWWVELNRKRTTVNDELQAATIAWAEAQKKADVADDANKAALKLAAERSKKEVESLTAQLESFDKQIEQQRTAEGLLLRNDSAEKASAGDLFRGEEVTDANTVDFGKVQMLFISIAVVGAYALILGDAIRSKELFVAGEVNLPDLAESLVALLGISHGGYLAVKASNSAPAGA
jgi:hypothetical protein